MQRLERQFQVVIHHESASNAHLEAAVEVVLDGGDIPLVLGQGAGGTRASEVLLERAIASSDIVLAIIDGSVAYEGSAERERLNRLRVYAETVGVRVVYVVLIAEDSLLVDSTERREITARWLDGSGKVFLCGPGDEFKYEVLRAIGEGFSELERPGLVRVPKSATFDLLSSVSENEFVFDTVKQLQAFHSLYERCSYRTEEKRALARFFRETYMDRIVDNEVSLFFESGATIAHVARELAGPLADSVTISDSGRPNIQISTNNVLAYLQFWLISRVPCTTFPWGPPSEETYGASYGGLDSIEVRRPSYNNETLDSTARREIDRLLKAPYTPTFRSPTLLFGAVSGLQIGPEYTLRFKPGVDGDGRQALAKEMERCAGPHVNSYHNKVFKRFMYATGLPIVICLTAEKIDTEIAVGDSHFILDGEDTWGDFYRRHPLAFCVGSTVREKARCASLFEDIGFEIVSSPDTESVTAFIARNEVFKEHCDRWESRAEPYL